MYMLVPKRVSNLFFEPILSKALPRPCTLQQVPRHGKQRGGEGKPVPCEAEGSPKVLGLGLWNLWNSKHPGDVLS